METTTNTVTSEIFAKLWDAPASTRGWMNVEARKFWGQEGGRCSILSLRNTPGLGLVATVHEEGGSYWAGRSMKSGYAPAQVHTILLDQDVQNAPSTNRFRYVLLASAPTGEIRDANARTSRHDAMVAQLRKVGA